MQDGRRTADDVSSLTGRENVAGATRVYANRSEDEFEDIKRAVLAKLTLSVGKDPGSATDRDWFVAAALMARDRIIHRWLAKILVLGVFPRDKKDSKMRAKPGRPA